MSRMNRESIVCNSMCDQIFLKFLLLFLKYCLCITNNIEAAQYSVRVLQSHAGGRVSNLS